MSPKWNKVGPQNTPSNLEQRWQTTAHGPHLAQEG